MTTLTPWQQKNPALVERSVSQAIWNTLTTSVFPGAHPDSVIAAIDYCQARGLDVLQKPVHIVPMQIKIGSATVKRDQVMPGIGLYRIQAARSGSYAGADEPEFGPEQTETFTTPGNTDSYGRQHADRTCTLTYPLWCKVTVYKIVGGQRCAFTVKEFWKENYATAGGWTEEPNAMWKKRPHGQLAKCAEAQALRKAWPEIDAGPTAEEMEGKEIVLDERDVTPAPDDRKANGPQPLEKGDAQAPIEGEYQVADEQPAKKPNSRKKAPAQAPAADTEGARVSEVQIRLIKSRTAIHQVSNEDLLQHFKVDDFGKLPASQINEILAYAERKSA
jgi:phage recombination protein Bet